MTEYDEKKVNAFLESVTRYGYNFIELCEKCNVKPDIISEHGGSRGNPKLHMFSTAQRLAQHIMDNKK